ncbi:MAG: D-alanyl-D-alanine carboxypeptidase family protein, partial [Treponema sp.]
MKSHTEQNARRGMKAARMVKVSAAAILLAYAATVVVRAYGLRRAKPLPPLTESQKAELEQILNSAYPERNKIISPLPYKTKNADVQIGAKSAIIVEAKTGSILYEKNADQVIPPASLTKIFAMYVVLDAARQGKIKLSDTVPLPRECWACNMPPHSSLMFLGKNQRVTVEELLTGLAVCSGNDAAYALSFYVSGSMAAFVAEMNAAAAEHGLIHTHFEEASGYSERNTTTAREIAAFAKIYLERFPEALPLFHSRLSFKYPQAHNLAPEDGGTLRAQDWSRGLPERITMGIYQENTNPLLGRLEGADGLKTGFIDESGYNLVLTVKRGAMRIISVTLG